MPGADHISALAWQWVHILVTADSVRPISLSQSLPNFSTGIVVNMPHALKYGAYATKAVARATKTWGTMAQATKSCGTCHKKLWCKSMRQMPQIVVADATKSQG